MTISTAKVLDSESALSEFTAATAQAPAPARAFPRRRAGTGRAVKAKPRRARVDWYTLGVILLILASGAVCLYRLAWAMQP